MRSLKKRDLLILCVACIVTLWFFLPAANSDDVAFPSESSSSFNQEPQANIGSWYDEVWEAAGFYSTAVPTHTISPVDNTETWELNYQYTKTPEGKTQVAPAPDSASLPADAVVVEWNTSGHIHFSSGF